MTQTIYGGKAGSELLLAGHVLTVTLDAGAGARLQRIYGGTVVESAALSASTTYGPYLHDMEFRVSALAGATVTIDTAAQTAQGLNAAKTAAVDSLVSEAGIGPLKITAPDGTERGDTLTATPTAGWTVATYQWTRDGADIVGQTSSTYTLTLADEGALIGCRAGSPVYTYLLEIPAGTYPAGYMALNGGVLSLGSGVLSLV